MSAICLLLMLVVSLDGNVQTRMEKVFQEFEHGYTGEEYQNESFKYRLFIPTSSEQEKLPILLWLHGAGEYGRDNLLHLRWFDRIFIDSDHLEKYPFFVLAVQYPRENPMWFRSTRGWARGKSPKDDMGEIAIDVLRSVMKKYPIDSDRVYVAGISDGGGGCWEIVSRHPDLFAAAMPMAGGPTNSSILQKLIKVPIWAFNNSNDHLSPVEPIQQAVNEINRLGGIAHLTSDEGTVHDCWTAAFLNHDVVEWMLHQRRGSFCWHRPGQRPLNLWLICGEISIFAVIFLAVWREWKRRQLVRANDAEVAEKEGSASCKVPTKVVCHVPS